MINVLINAHNLKFLTFVAAHNHLKQYDKTNNKTTHDYTE